MKLLLITMAMVSLTFGKKWIPPDNEDVEIVKTDEVADENSRVVAISSDNTRKIVMIPLKPQHVMPSLLTLVNKSASARSPVPAPIMNPVGIHQPIGPIGIPVGGGPIGGPLGINPGGIGPQSLFFSPVRINVDPTSQLYVPPGSDGRIIVLLKNDGVGDVFFLSGGDDKNFFLAFDTTVVQLATGQTLAVTGRVRVPQFANSNMLSVLSVIVQRRTDSAISQRKIYIRTRSESGERWAPWCTIKTVTRCENYLDEAICANRFWNMRAEIQDTEAGLLSVSIKPDGRFLGEDFPVGTNDSVAIEQTVSCCTTGVDITAVDVRGNIVTCRADQYGIYLQTGDIIAIVLGVLLLILLIIILVLVICRCCKRRRSVNTAPPPRSKKADKA